MLMKCVVGSNICIVLLLPVCNEIHNLFFILIYDAFNYYDYILSNYTVVDE
jgi:hypothetical protein